MASRSIDLISKKKKNARAAHFFLISKKQICTCSTLFLSFLPLFCMTTMPFCTTKTSNFLLVTRYFYGGSVVCDYQRFRFLCSCSLLFFHCCSFSPCWPLAFLIFSPPLWNFHVFFQRNSSPLFSITCFISFSVIHVSVNIKLTTYKKHDFVVVFSS